MVSRELEKKCCGSVQALLRDIMTKEKGFLRSLTFSNFFTSQSVHLLKSGYSHRP